MRRVQKRDGAERANVDSEWRKERKGIWNQKKKSDPKILNKMVMMAMVVTAKGPLLRAM